MEIALRAIQGHAGPSQNPARTTQDQTLGPRNDQKTGALKEGALPHWGLVGDCSWHARPLKPLKRPLKPLEVSGGRHGTLPGSP